MDKYLRHAFRVWHHHYNKYKKHLPYHHKIEKFLKSRNAHLFIMLIIAAAIPFTVLSVQQIQDIRQRSKEAQQCDGSKLLNVTNDTDFKNGPFKDGEGIIFSHTDGPITDPMFQNQDYTGNGATGCTLDTANGWIRCKARYTSTSKKPQSDHTWEFHNDGIIKCNYSVLAPVKPTKDPTKPTKDPNKPTPTKKAKDPNEPTSTPKAGASGNPRVDMEPADCSASNNPRLKAEWDLAGGEGTNGEKCNVELSQEEQKWIVDTKCTDVSNFIIDNIPNEDDDLKKDTEYTLKVTTGKGKSSNTIAKTPACSGGAAKNPTTPEPKTPGTPDGKINPAENVKANYVTGKENIIRVTWNTEGTNAVSYKVILTDANDKNAEPITKISKTSPIEITVTPGKKYYYQVQSLDADGKSKAETKKDTDRTVSPSSTGGYPLCGSEAAKKLQGVGGNELAMCMVNGAADLCSNCK